MFARAAKMVSVEFTPLLYGDILMNTYELNTHEKRLLIPVRDAAGFLSVCEKTLWSITEPRGDLPCVRIGRAVRYDPADLRAWIESRKGGSEG